MDLNRLRELGGFVPPTPEKQEVTWQPIEGEPVTFSVHIKKLSAGTIEKLWSKTGQDRSHMAALIAEAVMLGDEGKERLSYDQAFDLDPSLAESLILAIDTVNPLKRRSVTAAKN